MSDSNKTEFNVHDSEKNIFVGRDINFQMYQPEFFTPNLDEYGDSKYISPLAAWDRIDDALSDKFLVLGGEGYEKSPLARFIALNVKEKIKIDSEAVKEWTGSANPQDFEQHLEKNEDDTIFILPNLSPQNVAGNLPGLSKVAREKGKYLIITTKYPMKKWQVGDEFKKLFWQPASSDSLYDPLELELRLKDRLNSVRYRLPDGLRGTEFKRGRALLGKRLLSNTAKELKSPESIEAFVMALTAFEEPVTESDIQKLVDKCQSNRQEIRKWYTGFLTPRDQLIALGLCLFDGFYDDQFFAAMEDLVEQAWHKRDSSLEGLDYCDLDSLRNYYGLIPVGKDGVRKIEGQHQEQRRDLLEIAWESHRRQILSALKVMEDLVRNSVLGGFADPELYGTEERRGLVRQVIGETLCNIGLKSIDAVEGTLLRLAAEPRLEIQAVVARAMAGWRDYKGQDKKLFDLMEKWQFETTVSQEIKAILEKRERDETEIEITAEVFIKATLALTVGFAALYDHPNKMDDKLCDLLEKLVKDTANPFIRIRFSTYTLPLVVRLHAEQLRDKLLDMTRSPLLNAPIGVSLAKAYPEIPQKIAEILDDWLDICEKKRPPELDENEFTHRDGILATAAFAYGAIEYKKNKEKGKNKEPITIDKGVRTTANNTGR